MSNKNQSSIEWLYEQLTLTWYDYNSGKDLLDKAQKMHEQEIVNAWEKGNHKEMRGGKYLKPLATQYYNETFNSDEA